MMLESQAGQMNERDATGSSVNRATRSANQQCKNNWISSAQAARSFSFETVFYSMLVRVQGTSVVKNSSGKDTSSFLLIFLLRL